MGSPPRKIQSRRACLCTSRIANHSNCDLSCGLFINSSYSQRRACACHMLPSTLFLALQSSQSLQAQIPGAFRLLQVISSQLRPVRSIAEVARHMEEPQLEQHVQQQQLLRQQQQQPQQHQQQPQQLPQASNTSPVAATAPYAPPTGVKKTFYKRKLPCPPATEFSSAEGAFIVNSSSCVHQHAKYSRLSRYSRCSQ